MLKFDGKVDIKTVLGGLAMVLAWIGFEYSQSGDIASLKLTQKFQGEILASHTSTLDDRGQWGVKSNERLGAAERDIQYLKEYFKETVGRMDSNISEIAKALNVKNLH